LSFVLKVMCFEKTECGLIGGNKRSWS